MENEPKASCESRDAEVLPSIDSHHGRNDSWGGEFQRNGSVVAGTGCSRKVTQRQEQGSR